jgi:hypothetical protein
MPQAPCFPRGYPHIREDLRLGQRITLRLKRPDGSFLTTDGWIELALYSSHQGEGIACRLKHDVPREEVPAGTEVWLVGSDRKSRKVRHKFSPGEGERRE